MKIKPSERICKSKMLIPSVEYAVLEISNEFGESEVDLSFKIINETGKEIWVDDWDCIEIPRVDRTIYYDF